MKHFVFTLNLQAFPLQQHIPGFGTIRGIPSDFGSRRWGPGRGRGRGRGEQFPSGPSYNKSKELYNLGVGLLLQRVYRIL